MSSLLEQVASIPAVERTRRNHALEHAIIHILGQKHPGIAVLARSGPRGLVIYGNLPTEDVARIVTEALDRLRTGERQLAIHPNCGTSLVTAGSMSGLAALAALGVQRIGSKKRGFWHTLGALPLAILASSVALVAAQPIGQRLQKEVTTDAEIGDLHIVSIVRRNQGRLVFHTVKTAG